MARSEVRERMLQGGPGVLSDQELLSTLGAGAANGRPVRELAWLSVAELRSFGLNEAQAAGLAAAFELGRRGAWAPPKRGERCSSPAHVFELMRKVAHLPVEEFHVVLLDARGRLLRSERVAQGGVSQCPVSPREVLRSAVREGACSIIFVHNHPSGDPAPSPEDVHLTERLRSGAELVGVVACDHVIVSTGGYFSFVEAGRWRR